MNRFTFNRRDHGVPPDRRNTHLLHRMKPLEWSPVASNGPFGVFSLKMIGMSHAEKHCPVNLGLLPPSAEVYNTQ
jgi:hypothetical protein